MVNLSMMVRRVDAFLDLVGVAVGATLLALGVETCHEGGSLGWPAVGAALLLINLEVARRRFARRRRPTSSP
ncbi:hypothetical protein [Streptomyces sp. NPDC008150]|uniref:hypothetical protein n=1 Tax=Streptomyces sp. NPDC008150 TaxID=3364816 RepID=UPI0036E76583